MGDGAKLTATDIHKKDSTASLFIYAQSTGDNAGKLNLTNSNGAAVISTGGSVTINGGTVNVESTSTGDKCNAYIYSTSDSVTINGGQVMVTGTDNSIISGSGGSITLGYTKLDDFILASHYPTTFTIKEGTTFAVLAGDGDEFTTLEAFISQGTEGITAVNANGGTVDTPDLAGKKLVPAPTITFNANGGTGAPYTQNVLSNTATALTANAFTRSGYTFNGWNDKQNGTGTSYADKAQVTLTKNVTLYAKWSLVSYTITYNLNGGTNDSENPTSYTVASGAVTLKAPTRTGYDFAGWTLNGSKITEIASGSIGSKTLTATWTPITYTITYNLDGGTASNPESYTIESESFTLNNPAKTGYTFAGWTGTDLTAVTQAVTIAKGSTGDRVYTANYTQNQAALSTIEVSVTGALTLTTTEGTAATSAYTASVTGKYSDGTSTALTDYSIEWTLDKNISGIQISNNGTLSVNDSVKAGTYALTITARATKDSVTGSGTRSVNLTVNAQKQEEQKQEEQHLNHSECQSPAQIISL